MGYISRDSNYYREEISKYLNQYNESNEISREQYDLDLIFKNESNSLLDYNHIYNIYMFEKNHEGIKASTYTSILMHVAIRNEPLEHIDAFFYTIDENYLTSWSLIALLRTTYTYRRHMTHWKKLYVFTYDKVEEEGLNPRQELYGLDI